MTENEQVVGIRLPQKVYRALKAQAKQEQRPVANLVRLILLRHVESLKGATDGQSQ